uniref:Retinoblastoma-associated protein B-box domain-containing protein n=2 Tax=Dunaliella tertiolecta TaxID=3047 RepID=A0A7S3VS94_DUNTE
MLRTPDFHMGLLTCSLELVSAAVFQHHVFLSTPAEIGFESSMLSVWDAAGWFLDCFSHEGKAGRPSMSAPGIAYLAAIKSCCEEELVLADGSHFYEIFFTGGGSLYAGGTATLVSSFVASLGRSAIQCTMVAAHKLAAHTMSGLPVPAADFIVACADLMDSVLMHRLDLLFGKHVGMLIICCIYGVAKVLGATLGFRSVALQVSDMYPNGNIMRQAKGQDNQQELLVTHARNFYNNVFLNACDHLVRKSAMSTSSGSVVAGGKGPAGSEGPPNAASGLLPTATIHFIRQSSLSAMKHTSTAQAVWMQEVEGQQPKWVPSPSAKFKLYR